MPEAFILRHLREAPPEGGSCVLPPSDRPFRSSSTSLVVERLVDLFFLLSQRSSPLHPFRGRAAPGLLLRPARSSSLFLHDAASCPHAPVFRDTPGTATPTLAPGRSPATGPGVTGERHSLSAWDSFACLVPQVNSVCALVPLFSCLAALGLLPGDAPKLCRLRSINAVQPERPSPSSSLLFWRIPRS